ncbi:MAG: metal ABC transporter permease [Spirochaetales bacterium]
MASLERGLIWLLTRFIEGDLLTQFFRSAQNTAILVGAMIAIAGGMLGTFLLLRGLALTSDAISHTVLLGIVVAFMVMLAAGAEPSLSSPWLLIGAAAAGVGTVVLTELIGRSGLVKQDAALGLVFPLLFAIAVVFVSRYVDDTHLDEDAVMVGEIGIAWANTNSYCFGECETVTITPDDPRANITRRCTNCRSEGIGPRDPGATFREVCTNCGEYGPAAAYQEGFLQERPVVVFWPESLTVTFGIALLTLLFVGLFYKELKLATFDTALARSLGFRPGLLLYALMTLVSLVAVGAFDAVGSILVIAFFIIPAATAYLLTDRLSVMLVLSGVIGTTAAYFGYELARGYLFGFDLNPFVPGGWDTSISASMVVTMLLLFVLAFLVSPKYGVVSGALRRQRDRVHFEEQVLLGHIYHHTGAHNEAVELTLATMPEHVRWKEPRLRKVYRALATKGLVRRDERGVVTLTERGVDRVEDFWQESRDVASARGAPPHPSTSG